MKKAVCSIVFISFSLLFLAGCSEIPIDNTNSTTLLVDISSIEETTEIINRDITLRVATVTAEMDSIKPMLTQIENWITVFERENPNVDVVLENTLSTERFQTELMAGKGPDVLLLPTTNKCYITNNEILYRGGIIPDVNLAMRNGLFYDISEYYDADEALGKEALQSTVMDAGVVDGKRYVLPLRYNLLAAYVDKIAFAKSGLDANTFFDKDIIDFWDGLTQHGDGLTASSALARGADNELNLIADIFDYDNQKVLLKQEDLTALLRAYQELLIIRGENQVSFHPIIHTYKEAVSSDTYDIATTWMNSGNCMFVGDLDFAIHNAVIAEAEEIELGMYPLKSTDGSVVANVTYYGAVSGGSKLPELAYEFLRYFLSEESQWEQYDIPSAYGCLMGDGWPVRIKGSVAELCKTNGFEGDILAIKLLGKEKVTNADRIIEYPDEFVSILNSTIDIVRFPSGFETKFSNLLNNVYTPYQWKKEAGRELTAKELAEKARAMDLESMAAQFIKDLEWHLAEG